MRALSIILAATALSGIMGSAQADAGSAQPGRATAQQMAEASGHYRLSDGRHAELLVLDGGLYARIGRGVQKEMLLAGPNRFVARDGSIAIRFTAGLDSERIVLEHARGSGAQDTIRLAANERASGRGAAD